MFQVRLICNDGTRYTKDIDIVRKCACTKKCYWLTDAAIHNSNTQSPEEIAQFNASETDLLAPRHAPMTQQLNSKPASTSQPYKLTFFVEGEKHNVNNLQQTETQSSHGNYDGLVVQSYDNPVENSKAARYAKDFSEHGSGCILSAFLYFVTITSFVYLAVLWIKQRMHMHVEQMQWW